MAMITVAGGIALFFGGVMLLGALAARHSDFKQMRRETEQQRKQLAKEGC